MKKGYTLTELIVVLAVIACITAVAFPNIKSLESYDLNKKLEDATNCVIEYLNYCRAYSREKSCAGYVWTTRKGIEYRLDNLNTVSKYKVPDGVILSTGPVWNKDANPNIKLNLRDGVLDGGSIYVVNSKGKYNKITIKAVTKYVSRYQ